MTSVTTLREVVDVVIGVDTHVKTHSAALVAAGTGAVLAEITVTAGTGGYQQLTEWADSHAEEHGALRAWAIEGTGSHGAGLTRHLHRDAEVVVELDRPERAKRRNGAKSDPLDAIRAAREALSRTKLGTPRGDSENEHARQSRQSLSVLLAARRSAIEAAGVAARQVFALVIAAPEPVRARFREQNLKQMVRTAATLRTGAAWANVDLETTTILTTLRNLGRRARDLQTEADDYEKSIRTIIRAWRPEILDEPGVGPIGAAIVLCAWSHPGRIRSEAAFAMLAGAAPIPANSGQVTTRHRLNPYGDRQLNKTLHTIAVTRQRCDPRTRAYVERRTQEGKTAREARRCLKRYIARDLYRLLENTSHTLDKT